MTFEANNQGLPLECEFSVSIRDASKTIESYNTDNIAINLLLSSELKGYIEDAGYYFESDDIQHKHALDLLMMVQGWRRYQWKQIAGLESFEIKYGIENQLVLEGHISSIIRKKRQKDIEVKMTMLNVDQKESLHGFCVTDENGEFNFGLGEIYGKWNLTLESKKKNKHKHLNIILDRNISPIPRYFSFYEKNIPQKDKNETINLNEIIKTTSLAKGIIAKNNTAENIKYNDSIESHMLDEVIIMEKNLTISWKRHNEMHI